MILISAPTTCIGQKGDGHNEFSKSTSLIINSDSGIYFINFVRANCKGYQILQSEIVRKIEVVRVLEKSEIIIPAPVKSKVKLLAIHGNIYYDFFYRSAIDTPINQKNFQQHTERINLEIMVKEKYPLKVSFTARQSNSPYFRNFFDPNFQFDKFAYNKNIKQALLNRINKQLPERPDLKLSEALLKEEMDRYLKLKNRLESPATLQKIIEEREKGLGNKTVKNDNTIKGNNLNLDNPLSREGKLSDSLLTKGASLKNKLDSSVRNYTSRYEKEKTILDSLAKRIRELQRRTDSIKNSVQKEVMAAREKINKATSQKDLIRIAGECGVKPESKNKIENQLAAIKNFSIGRSVLNYTELTAQNITVTGLNIEYNPSYYAALAVGKIDYRFRDFYNKDSKRTSRNTQYIVMGRLGIGDINKKALIFSLFQGRKNTAEYSLSDTLKNYVNIMGYSVEAIYKKDDYTSLSAEFAKSTKPVTGNLQSNKQTSVLWKYSDKTNMGVNVKAQTYIPVTKTNLSGFFRKTGENFQSFSLFSYNTDQTAWLARVDQEFLKNRIKLTGMLRRNDFSNPFTDKTFKTSTVFKSIILNVRFPKYPSLSLGYYPGTQLYLVNKELIRENAYYILNGSLVYSYFFKNTGLNTTVVYNRYTNQATDSGFVLYKGVNYYAAQTVFLRRLQLQGGYSYTKQPELEFYTLETSGDYSFKKMFRINVGAKYNKVSSGNNYWGERIQLTADFKKLGQFQLQYEKSYLPTIKQTLYPVEIGRVSYYKYF